MVRDMKIGNRNYFLWLLKKIEWYEIDVYEHKELLEILYNTEFVWSIENDANRASKGLNLRYEYDKNWDYGEIPCSVLEMLIALARDWEHEITYDFKKGDRTAKWFWVMLENLGVFHTNYLSSYQISGNYTSFVNQKLVYWMGREFDEHGVGSPFPIKNIPDNQKKVEIWMQLQNYVVENVEI